MPYASLYAPSWQRRRVNGLLRGIEGVGLDVGAGAEPAPWWKMIEASVQVQPWDQARGDGDATYLDGVEDESFDFVFSSHLLEHLARPEIALRRWVDVTRRGGSLLVAVPHRDLYEKRRRLPSTFNPRHLRYYLPTLDDEPDTVGLYPWLVRMGFALQFEILAVQTGDWGYVPTPPGTHPVGEYQIDALLRRL